MIKKIKNTVPGTYAISDLNGEEILEFAKTKLQKICLFRIQFYHKQNNEKL